jgi:large subunit ribosomal protein L15
MAEKEVKAEEFEQEPKAEKAAKPAKAEKAPKAAKADKPAEPAPDGQKDQADQAAKAAADQGDGPDQGESAASGTTPKRQAPKSKPLKVHHLRPAPGAKKAKKRVGRGESSKGKTAGRGTKGTKARGQVPARLEGGQMPLHMRLPKLRGFKNPFRVEYQVVNLDKLALLYPDGGEVTAADLVARGVVRDGYPVKVLGGGEIGVKLDVKVDALSASAKEKILAAGGSVNS